MAGIEEERLNQLWQRKAISKAELQKYNTGQGGYGGVALSDGQFKKRINQTAAGLSDVRTEGLSPSSGGTIGGPVHDSPPADKPTGAPAEILRPVKFPIYGKPVKGGSQRLIDNIYEKSRESQMAALEGQYKQQVNEYDKQKGEAPEKFNPLRNEAYVNHEMAERSRKESMANMGLSGAGGMSQTLEQRNTGNLLSTLGGISRQQQDYTDNINFALGQLTTQYDSNKSSINLQIDSEKNKASLDQGNWEKNFGLQEEQFGLSKSDSEFNRYMQLYKKGLIHKKQLKAKFPEYF